MNATSSAVQAGDLAVLLRMSLSGGLQGAAAIQEEFALSGPDFSDLLSRAENAGLFSGLRGDVRRLPLFEFSAYAAKYVFPVALASRGRGVATAWSAPPLSRQFVVPENGHVVWPDPRGDLVGEMVEPLHPRVPAIARQNPSFHELLALVDAIRVGRARDVLLAREALQRRIL